MLILLLRMALGRGAMNNFKFIFLGFLSLYSFTACTDAGVDVTGNEDTPKIFLRDKPKDGRYRFRLALRVAELRIENGCVQLIQGDDTENPYTPSWPAYTRLIETEDGIRDSVASRGLGDVYKRQSSIHVIYPPSSIRHSWFCGPS